MALTPAEYWVLNAASQTRRGKPLDVAPLTRGILGVTLYQMLDDVCPFHDATANKCGVYSRRPTVCRMFPMHPHGLMNCEDLMAKTRRFPEAQIGFPREIRDAVNLYSLNIDPIIRSAQEINDLNAGWVKPGRLPTVRKVF